METLAALVDGLTGPDRQAYACLKALLARSAASNEVYAFFDRFCRMMDDENSYVRTRGLVLIAANARWDADNRVDECIDAYLTHILDVKPITARQCIKALPQIARYKPDLRADVEAALRRADPGRYPASMAPLVAGDLRAALGEIAKME